MAHPPGRRPLRRGRRASHARRGRLLPARRLHAPRARGAGAPMARRPAARPRHPLRRGRTDRPRIDGDRDAGRPLAPPRRGRLPARPRPPRPFDEAAVTRPFRLALPSKGRLHGPALELARAAGVEVDVNGRALHAHCSRWDIEVLFARADDIPAWTADGEVDELVPLGFGRCALEVAVPADGRIAAVDELDGGRVATAHPRTAAAFFAAEGLSVETIPIRGSVELAPRLDAADGIVDLVSSGDTLRQNGLRPIATVLESQATLVARRELDGAARAVASELATVVE